MEFRSRTVTRASLIVVTALTATLTTACGSSGSSAQPSISSQSTAAGSATAAETATGTEPSGSGESAIAVVASTNVWGDVIKAIGGDLVAVTAFIDDPAADPHSYEANAQNQLAISKSALIVENGGGYDDFVDNMIKSAKPDATVINAVEVSGLQAAAGDELNEHVWYDFPTVVKVADAVEQALATADPAHAADFQAGEKQFTDKVTELIAKEATLKNSDTGKAVAITEPVPLYMLEAIGADNKTPAEFSEAVEEGEGVSPAVLKETEDLFSNKVVKALVYNEQTSGPETDALLAAAKSNDIPVVPVTETLPPGKTYLTWMESNLDAIATALG